MDLFELFATLGLDTLPFVSSLNETLGWALQQLVNFAGDVVKTGMGFDEEMSAVQAVLGKEEGTVENMIRLREEALEQARTSVFTSEEVATAYYYMGMAGWKTEQMLAGLPGILDLAAASGEDLGRVSDIVTDSITAFGLTADDVSTYVDILAQTATNSNTDVRRMGETFKYVAPIAGALGYDVEDVALSIGLLASAGIKGSQAGTTLRNVFTRIATNAGATTKDLGALQILTDKLGVSFYDAEGNARDWGTVLTELRTAWKGMNEGARQWVIGSFNDMIDSGEDYNATITELERNTEKLNDLQEQLDATKVESEYDRIAGQMGAIGSQYDDLLTLLDIPIPDQVSGYADALDQARIKLGLMTDEEKIYFSKQISSMRGMSGLLRMLGAEDEEVEKLTQSLENAAGAAEEMADTRLDNLAGDIRMFNSAMDTMKYAIFDDIKGPLRDIVQYGTDAINRITDAINENGLEGGIEQLGLEILQFSDFVRPILEGLGEALAPIVVTLFDTILPSVLEIAVEVGSKFAQGLIQGFTESLPKKSGLINSLIGFFGGEIDDPNNRVTVSLSPDFEWDYQYSNDDSAFLADTIIKDVQQGLQDGLDKETIMANLTNWRLTVDPPLGKPDEVAKSGLLPALASYINDYFADQDIGLDLEGPIVEDAAGAGAEIAASISTELGAVDASSMTTAIESAGASAAASVATSVSTALSGRRYSIDVTANVVGLSGAVVRAATATKYAKGMSGGYILNRGTVFGLEHDGSPRIGGEAGPEAVVGVNSLDHMIQSSVAAAMSGVAEQIARAVTRQRPQIVLDTGALVGGIKYEMDNQLNDIANWRGAGRA